MQGGRDRLAPDLPIHFQRHTFGFFTSQCARDGRWDVGAQGCYFQDGLPPSYLMWPKLNTMKHFVTLVACLASFFALAQNPNYDPDSNGDDLIGAEDLVSLLGVYNTSLAIDTTLECDFDGTAEDEWLFGILTGEVIVDSIVVQYSISDSATYFEPGCPTMQIYNLDVEMEYTMIMDFVSQTSRRFICEYPTPWGTSSYAALWVKFDSDYGWARWYWDDYNLSTLYCCIAPYEANFNFRFSTGNHYTCTNSSEGASTFTLSESGLVGDVRCNGGSIESGPWNDSEYNYFRILPYWHYAE